MWILNTDSIRTLLYRKDVNFPSPSFPKSLSFSHHHICANNTSSDSHPFALSYLINDLGFSPQLASKLCSTYKFRFKTAETPNTVLTFFRNHGFSDSQLHSMIVKAPWLLSCNPYERVLPKFEFFLSKGISDDDIVSLVSQYPNVLSPSLKTHIVPIYELVYRFLQSDKEIFALLYYYPTLFSNSRMEPNIKMLIENGMTDSCIARLLRTRSAVLTTGESEMLKVVEELKDLGFHPSKSTFVRALLAKLAIPKTRWNEKVNTFKKWGWSDENIMRAFRIHPQCMLTSVDKINSVMRFWVNHLDWDVLVLVKRPHIFSLSLERRVIPRATVVQFLLKKGLRNTIATVSTFKMSEKLFLDKFVKCFEEDSSYLLKLYEEKMNHAYTGDKTGMS